MKNSYYEITKKKKKEYVCVVAEKRKWRLEIGFVGGEQTNKDTHFTFENQTTPNLKDFISLPYFSLFIIITPKLY